jgi:hypothetical protein
MTLHHRVCAVMAAGLALMLSACAQPGGPSPLAEAPGQITTGSIDRKPEKGPNTEAKVQALSDASLTFAAAGSPADVYVLVARGAMSCWFGATGPLRRSHVFMAEVDPPAKGGAALVTLHEKDVSLPDQRGVRAFQVAMRTAPAGTEVTVATPKISPEIAEAMKQDVQLWARGKTSCELSTILAPTPIAQIPQPAPRPKAASKPVR